MTLIPKWKFAMAQQEEDALGKTDKPAEMSRNLGFNWTLHVYSVNHWGGSYI